MVRHKCSTMKTATVRDLRNHYTSLLSWIGAGEEIEITQRGKVIARLVPAQGAVPNEVDWSQSPAVKRNRSAEGVLTAKESLALIQDSRSRW